MTRIFLIIILIGSVSVAVLYFTHEGIFYKKHDNASEGEVGVSDTSKLEYYHALPPNLFLEVIKHDDSNFTAGEFHKSIFERTRNNNYTMFQSDNSTNLAHQWVYIYDKKPSSYFYVFDVEQDALQFFDSVKSSGGSSTYINPISKNLTLRLQDCLFEYIGYNLDNKGFTVSVYNLDKVIKDEKKRIKDSLTQALIMEHKTLDSIRKANKSDDPFEQDTSILRDTKGRIILEQ